jgi:hypothetical protein
VVAFDAVGELAAQPGGQELSALADRVQRIDPEVLRAVGRGLGAMAEGVDGSLAALGRHGEAVRAGWGGRGAEAFAEHVGDLGRAGRTTLEATGRMRERVDGAGQVLDGLRREVDGHVTRALDAARRARAEALADPARAPLADQLAARAMAEPTAAARAALTRAETDLGDTATVLQELAADTRAISRLPTPDVRAIGASGWTPAPTGESIATAPTLFEGSGSGAGGSDRGVQGIDLSDGTGSSSGSSSAADVTDGADSTSDLADAGSTSADAGSGSGVDDCSDAGTGAGDASVSEASGGGGSGAPGAGASAGGAADVGDGSGAGDASVSEASGGGAEPGSATAAAPDETGAAEGTAGNDVSPGDREDGSGDTGNGADPAAADDADAGDDDYAGETAVGAEDDDAGAGTEADAQDDAAADVEDDDTADDAAAGAEDDEAASSTSPGADEGTDAAQGDDAEAEDTDAEKDPDASGDAAPTGGPQGQVGDWIREAMAVLQAEGVPVDKMDPDDIATIIEHESGGDPEATNDWDSNAAKGTPSQGLMQTIGPTFDSYKLDGHEEIKDPVDNIIAGVRYAIDRYGSVSQVPGVEAVARGDAYVGY